MAVEQSGAELIDVLVEPPLSVPVLVKRPIDPERLLWWAMEQSGRLPWDGVSYKDLAFDHGWTARPQQGTPEYHGSGVSLRRSPSSDANMIIDAIRALEPAIAAVVLACARKQIRPDYMRGVTPMQVEHKLYARKRGKRRGRHVRSSIKVWEPCSPETICAARVVYQHWHVAVEGIGDALRNQLSGWKILEFSAPSTPWETDG